MQLIQRYIGFKINGVSGCIVRFIEMNIDILQFIGLYNSQVFYMRPSCPTLPVFNCRINYYSLYTECNSPMQFSKAASSYLAAF